MLGIVKAYTTRVGGGPFPTELFDKIGEHICEKGQEFGAVTGRRRRCGWFDAVAMRRSKQLNSLSGLCLTKLDILDGLDEVKICTGYRHKDGTVSEYPPMAADDYDEVTAVYETCPGWKESTFGAKSLAELPANAVAYVKRLEEILGLPVDILSTGPDRSQTITLRDPFEI